MKILHINTEASSGGAAIAASRHCEAMNLKGVESRLLAYNGKNDDLHIIYPSSKSKRFWVSKMNFIRHKLSRLIVKRVAWHWSESDISLVGINEVREADVIYLHWINGFLSYQAIRELLDSKKRVIWYMHDMWPFTGGCHYSFECKGYENACKNCPQMKCAKNLPNVQLMRKIKEWGEYDNLYLAAPSVWLSNCIRQSKLFAQNKVFTCPNVIDTDLFKPINKTEVRQLLGLPLTKKLILFSAMGVSNPYKGTQYLNDALKKLASYDYEFVIIGDAVSSFFSEEVADRIHLMGFVNETLKMVQIYNSVDLLVITSLAENFPNVVIEAMSCAIPVVGFSTGGIKEQIRHKENGYLADPKDVEGIVEGIHWVLNKSNYPLLCNSARTYVVEKCSYYNVLENHKLLLDGIL